MIELNLPTCNLNIREVANGHEVFDSFRKRFVSLTPEEWVRQNFLNFMVDQLGYPKGLISVEQQLKLNGLTKRCDILAYSKTGNPVLLVECKAPSVNLTNEVFAQVARYNITLQVPFLAITNGLAHYAARISLTDKQFEMLAEFPTFDLVSTV
ncbi:type I restriction enzyme HsdR N-terminal domain-containing protein [Williamwhitmania taraxaci]|uniref:Type I restriction enzyme R protein N terminus (HSDR_N) n=1 Tax=Williamwhitmania taraxaci TaxID=1640674 RepID=A0A1G6KED1_9BACT|nr:type I restriction enzyme HsdR N-terminal domain-containing protein [Williamwhitmania taraxaci]SDC29370.1 Type I restriction enzyme R protein N terminus (HSDR_N) [Williamwhitmania taraxaci]